MSAKDEEAEKRRADPSSISEIFNVVVIMRISDDLGRDVDSKTIDFGKLKPSEMKGLAELFSMLASNIEYIKKLEPQYEKLDKSKPSYLL